MTYRAKAVFRIAHAQSGKNGPVYLFQDSTHHWKMVGEWESQTTNQGNKFFDLREKPCQRYVRIRFGVPMRVRERGGATLLVGTKNLFSEDHARSRLTPFCAKRTVSAYVSFVVGR